MSKLLTLVELLEQGNLRFLILFFCLYTIILTATIQKSKKSQKAVFMQAVL